MIAHSRPWIIEEDQRELAVQLASGDLASGSRVAEFERELATYLGVAGAVATASGSAALQLGMRALGLGTGDEVILPTYVCESVWDSVVAVGATPVLCDVGESWVMSAATARPHVTPRTRALIAVHVFGIPAPVAELAALGVSVIEDCAQALGVAPAASSAFSFFSFHATKCLTTGTGGALASADAGLLERARAGTLASPLSDLQAALGCAQLRRYGRFLERRATIAADYLRALSDLPVQLPAHVQGTSIFFRFPVRVRGRSFDAVRAGFAGYGVHVRRGVDALLHRVRPSPRAALPGAERMFEETVSLPIYPALSADDQTQVVTAACAVFGV